MAENPALWMEAHSREWVEGETTEVDATVWVGPDGTIFCQFHGHQTGTHETLEDWRTEMHLVYLDLDDARTSEYAVRFDSRPDGPHSEDDPVDVIGLADIVAWCSYCSFRSAEDICPEGSEQVGEPICHACARMLTDDARQPINACLHNRTFSDAAILDLMQDAMSGREWDADVSDRIAELLRLSGREIADSE